MRSIIRIVGNASSKRPHAVTKESGEFQQGVREVVEWVGDARLEEAKSLNSDSEFLVVAGQV